ncbi:MAG: hypothetical protein IK096_04190 [Lachnospiraceae bacterium]|nr:hypothetical protein [Lachnospiraceae bacterium]
MEAKERTLSDEMMESVTGGASAKAGNEKLPYCKGGKIVRVASDSTRIEGGNTGLYECPDPTCKKCKNKTQMTNLDVTWK